MPKNVSALELALNDRPRNETLTRWLYGGLCRAILDGRLHPPRVTRLAAALESLKA